MAAIDCGTNSIRLLVADLPEASAGPQAPLTDVTRRMEIVRLGQGVDRTGRLAPEAIERTRVALAGYAAEIEKLGVDRVRMCATSASRDAANAADFRAMVQRHPRRRARGGHRRRGGPAVVHRRGARAARRREPPYLVVDIGGGSTEFVVGDRRRRRASGDLGGHRLRPDDRAAPARRPADGRRRSRPRRPTSRPSVDRALAAVPGREAATLVGLAGSVTTVVAIAQDLREYDPERIHHARVSYERGGRGDRRPAGADRARSGWRSR